MSRVEKTSIINISYIKVSAALYSCSNIKTLQLEPIHALWCGLNFLFQRSISGNNKKVVHQVRLMQDKFTDDYTTATWSLHFCRVVFASHYYPSFVPQPWHVHRMVTAKSTHIYRTVILEPPCSNHTVNVRLLNIITQSPHGHPANITRTLHGHVTWFHTGVAL